jgi:hypothetical protein
LLSRLSGRWLIHLQPFAAAGPGSDRFAHHHQTGGPLSSPPDRPATSFVTRPSFHFAHHQTGGPLVSLVRRHPAF